MSDLSRRNLVKLNVSTTQAAIEHVKEMRASTFSNKNQPENATVAYNFYSFEQYPLKIHFNNCDVLISGVSAGYGGEGPHGTVDILKIFGFKVDEELKRAICSKKYVMNDRIELHINFDGTFSYLNDDGNFHNVC